MGVDTIFQKTLLAIVCTLLLLAGLAQAAPAFKETQATLEVDYSSFDEDEDTIPETGKVTLTNTGTGNAAVRLMYRGLPADYEGTDVVQNIGTGETEVSFTIKVPHEKDAGNEPLGFLVLKDESNGTILQEISLRQQTKSMLQLKELIVEYVSEENSEEEDVFDERDDNFRTTEFAKPGTNVTLRFTLENLFDNSYEDGTLEDLQITLEADDEDLFAEAFPEDYELDPLAADKTIEFWVSFLIADDADAGDYTFEITIEAEDEKGARHSVNRELLLDVQREDDDVRITKAALLPATLSCATEFTLDVAIKNFGADNQDHAGITIFSQKLGINKHVKDIELEEFDEDDTTWEEQFRFSVPTGISAGSYPLEVRAFVDQDQLEEILPLSLQVSTCAQEEEENTEVNETNQEPPIDDDAQDAGVIAEEPEEDTELFQEGTQQISSSAIVATVENPYTLQDVLVAMLFVSVVLALAIITLLLSNLVAPRTPAKRVPKTEKKAEEKSDRSQKRKTNREVKRT